MYYLKLIVSLILVQANYAEFCTTPNDEPGECVDISSCTFLYDALHSKHEAHVDEFAEKSICGGTKLIPKVCCGKSRNFKIPKANNLKKHGRDLLSNTTYCGLQHSDDYYQAENDISLRLNDFPWFARIKHFDGTNILIECGGSLINTRYVITSGFCVDQDLYLPVGVRLGEFHLRNKTDCINKGLYENKCNNFEDFGIEKIIRHLHYSNIKETNDIALVRLDRTVRYSDYIRPICLPLPEAMSAKVGDVFITSGYDIQKRNVKKRVLRKLITREECIKKLNVTVFHLLNKKFNEDTICTLPQDTDSKAACNSDIGGPVMISNHFQWYQEAIVNFRGTCGQDQIPEIHISLRNHLKWIEENLED